MDTSMISAAEPTPHKQVHSLQLNLLFTCHFLPKDLRSTSHRIHSLTLLAVQRQHIPNPPQACPKRSVKGLGVSDPVLWIMDVCTTIVEELVQTKHSIVDSAKRVYF
jgi:hypothetical protein